MVNQKTGIKEADMKALFHAICVGASSMQDTNTALAFKFIQLGAEVRAAMASGIVTNHEEMCTIFDCAYMETRGRSTTTTAPPTGRPQVVYLAQEYERPQAQPHYHAQGGRGSGARGGGTNGGGARGRRLPPRRARRRTKPSTPAAGRAISAIPGKGKRKRQGELRKSRRALCHAISQPWLSPTRRCSTSPLDDRPPSPHWTKRSHVANAPKRNCSLRFFWQFGESERRNSPDLRG